MCIVPISPGVAAIVHHNGYTVVQCGATVKLNAMNQNKIAFLLDLWDNNSKLAVKITYFVFQHICERNFHL